MSSNWFNDLRFKGKVVDKYMTNKSNLVRLIVFTAIFSLCFINLYCPFDSMTWYEEMSRPKYFLVSSLLVLVGILVIAFSRFLMYRFVRKHSLYYLEYAVWVVAEVFVLSVCYTCMTIAVNDNLSWWSWHDVIEVFKSANINTFLVILLPYSVSWLYFSYEDKKRRLQRIEESMKPTKDNVVLQFRDEKGEIRFSVASNKIVYIESADNYVIINYESNNKMTSFMLRNTLKRVAHELRDMPIKRCHRSYMVNFERITALRRKNDEVSLEFDIVDIKEIPVSKTYANEMTEAFLLYSGCKK
ncbi:MAG TPA: LytTR family DNA-binding domain-containing protein [Paludibacteraceae bacterium]|nr:LytTR family DNA-binding domain-containing protein [Paludibacteraceae bacterium]HOO23562.1 LytTR family DNA-binding domain-containing protein [Paludibacteraceae bacterium]HOS37164.1 LytTR family DNA-binding domain-containing protein [Paludibacteraceae bacterium]HPK20976.1 LytTR family DNA-binding domain-containing protein [Paludibacteraceae bacterium]